MNISIKKNSGKVVIIEIDGEVDMLSAPEVRDQLLPFFTDNMKGVVIDLSGVTYMDSSGIATMIEGLQWSTRTDKKFIIAGLTEAVMDVFVLTNLKDVFEFSDNSDAAFDSITAS